MRQTITITFGDRAENSAGMQMLGELASNGFTMACFEQAKQNFEGKDFKCELINLNKSLPAGEPAAIFVVRGGVDALLGDEGSDKLYRELIDLKVDTKMRMRGRVVNKRARHNLIFGPMSQEADYERGRGTVIPYKNVPYLTEVKDKLPEFFGYESKNLWAEGNYYYDPEKCGTRLSKSLIFILL